MKDCRSALGLLNECWQQLNDQHSAIETEKKGMKETTSADREMVVSANAVVIADQICPASLTN